MYHIKPDKRSTQSAKWIYEALLRLMEEKSYDSITVTEIVNHASVARATFYRNFDHLDDVLLYKLDETFDKLVEYMSEYYRESPQNPLRTVFLKPFLRFWNLHSELVTFLIKANRLHLLNEGFDKVLSQMLANIRSGDVNFERLDYFKAMRTGQAISVLVHWVKNNKDLAPDDLADLIINQTFASMNLELGIL